jgi:hypothetical protein
LRDDFGDFFAALVVARKAVKVAGDDDTENDEVAKVTGVETGLERHVRKVREDKKVRLCATTSETSSRLWS